MSAKEEAGIGLTGGQDISSVSFDRLSSTASNHIPIAAEVADELVSGIVGLASSLAHAFESLETPGGGVRLGEGWAVVQGTALPSWVRIGDPDIMTNEIPSENVVAARLLVENRCGCTSPPAKCCFNARQAFPTV